MTAVETLEAIAKLINCEVSWLHPHDYGSMSRDDLTAWICQFNYDGAQIFHRRIDGDWWGQLHKLDNNMHVVHMPLEEAAEFALQQISGNDLFIGHDQLLAHFPVFSSYEELLLKIEISGEKLLLV